MSRNEATFKRIMKNLNDARICLANLERENKNSKKYKNSLRRLKKKLDSIKVTHEQIINELVKSEDSRVFKTRLETHDVHTSNLKLHEKETQVWKDSHKILQDLVTDYLNFFKKQSLTS